ncbi:response regulator [Porticoccus sp. GXU_MW_L64]
MPTHNRQTIVLVEDDKKLSGLLCTYLQNNGFSVLPVYQGNEAADTITSQQPALVILDLMLPGTDGLNICREVRPRYPGKILMLTASDDDIDQVAALEIGADDYVTKPIQPRVLLARIRMLLRRTDAEAEPQNAGRQCTTGSRELRFGGLYLHQSLHQCQLNNDIIDLTPSEFDLLWLLASHADEILSRDQLTKAIRGIDYNGLDRTVDNKIASLRKKLGDSSARPKRLITVRGKGYLFVPDYW